MAISTLHIKEIFMGDGANTQFQFSMQVIGKGQINCLRVLPSGEEIEILPTEFSIKLTNDGKNGGEITYPLSGSPLAADQKLVVYRKTDIIEDYAPENGKAFDAVAIEKEIDRLTMQNQEQEEQLNRAVKLPIGSTDDPNELLDEYVAQCEAAKNTAEEKAAIAEDKAAAAEESASEAAQSAVSAAKTVEGFDPHVAEKQGLFDANVASKTEVFNNNASEKLAAYNGNHDAKLKIYNDNHEAKLAAYNANAAKKQDSVDASADAAAQSAAEAKQYRDEAVEIVNLPEASETVAGIAEIATDEEMLAGTDNTKIVTPLKAAGANQRILDIMDSLDAQNVKLTGNQTVKGVKTFCQSGGRQQQHLLIQNDEMERSIPAESQYVGFAFLDKLKNWLTWFRHHIGPTGLVRCSWSVSNLDGSSNSELYHGFDTSGNWDSNIVVTNKNRSQSISGRKTFSGSGIGIIKSGSAIDIQNPNVDLSITDGSASGTTEIHFIDKNGIIQGIVEHQNRTSGELAMILAARNHANNAWTTLECGFDKNDNPFARAPIPSLTNNSADIATTSWVRNYSKNYAAQLNYAAAVTIVGTGAKTAPASGALIMTGKGSSAVGQFLITIGGQTFNCAQGYSGVDYNHATFAYFPVGIGQSYTIEEISASCDLRFIPYI